MNHTCIENQPPGAPWRLLLASSIALLASTTSATPAFYGAEGAGAASVGGRGGRVIKVTTTADYNPSTEPVIYGSLRAALAGKVSSTVTDTGPRTIVFTTGGTITLKAALQVLHPFVTVAGQTAPGGGIQIRGTTSTPDSVLRIRTNDVIWRFTRLRRGFYDQANPDNNNDNLTIENNSYNIIIDHNSIMWSEDENVGIWGSDSNTLPPAHDITISWNLIAEPLYEHKTQVLTGAATSAKADVMTNIDFTKNYMANSGHRNPLLKHKSGRFVSNLMYNARRYYMQMGAGVSMDVISNLYKQQSSNPIPAIHEFDAFPNPSPTDSRYPTGTASLYIAGNRGPNNLTGSADNWTSMARRINRENSEAGGAGETTLSTTYKRSPWLPLPPVGLAITPIPAVDLATELLVEVGASRRLDANGNWVDARDSADDRIVQNYLDGTGYVPERETDTGPLHGGSGPAIGGYPTLASGTAYADTDHDGMADAWEASRGVSDKNADPDLDGFTNLEEFLNGTDPNSADHGQLWLQAEHASNQSLFSPLAVVADSTASNGNYIRSTSSSTSGAPANGRATFHCNLSGTVAIWGRMKSFSASEDSFWASYNGGTFTSFYNTTGVHSQWVWVKYGEVAATGNSTFTIAYREANTQLDRVLFTTDLGFTPNNLGETKLWREAELTSAQSLFSPYAVVADGAASGGSYIKTTVSSTGGVPSNGRVAFNSNLTGTVAIWVRAYCPSLNADSMWVDYDGTGFANFFNTGANGAWVWMKWGERAGTGNNTLTIAHKEADTRIDRVLFTTDLGYTPTGTGP